MSTFRLLFDETCVATNRARVWRCTGVALLAAFLAVFSVNANADVDNQPSVAIYYGNDVPVAMLDQFDWAVVESEHMGEGQLDALEQYGTQAFAYVSLGEAEHWRAGETLPNEAFKARNEGWNSQAADLTRKEWGDYIINKRIRPLWSEGYRAVFLDTLDSYRLFATDDESVKAQQQALVALIKRIRTEFPGVKLLLNRGFEILDQVRSDIVGVAAESLYKSWDVRTQSYRDVKPEDTQYVLDRLREVRNDYGLPAIAIDYVDPADRDTARATARRIADDGIVPWVSNGALNQVGVGSIEPMPRKVLVLYDASESDYGELAYSSAHLNIAMPLEYLGYGAVYKDVDGALPDDTLRGRYAGVVSWFLTGVGAQANYRDWLLKQMRDGVPVALLGDPGIPVTGELSELMGLQAVPSITDQGLAVVDHDDFLGFEGMPEKPAMSGSGYSVVDDKVNVHLKVRDGNGAEFVPVATGDWGGVALSPWAIQQGLADQSRWILDPFKFIKTALALPDMPVADATTENGSRYWMTEVDGDAFNSRASAPGSPFNAQLLLDRILKKYRVPTTVSVITGEIGPDGLYPELTDQVEPIAREIFKLPWVEIGTHTYSHPFEWLGLTEGELTGAGRTAAGYAYNLPLKNYRFDLEREIAGSTRYINDHLAPPGKKVKAVLWSGNALPPEKALAIAERIGIANINGADTHVMSDNPTLTDVMPMLRPLGDHIQVYSPQTNENVYTNNMTGPLWGYRRVIESYKITNEPRRLKPIDIYFHFYSATYPASLKALNQVFSYALSQQTVPVYASTYSRIARNWYDVGVARTLDGGWQITGATQMRTVRLPERLGWPDVRTSRGVVGVRDLTQGRYVALSGEPRVKLNLASGAPSVPYVHRSNGRITQWRHSGGDVTLEMAAEHVPLEIELAGTAGCRVSANGASRRGGGNTVTLRYTGSTSGPVRIDCG
ncbi:PelA protein [Salinisphaera shabanensis E1L3A]|uniref:PelA protein n=1 Tax=Salinisphaera shabanensis E1L3A TaxID=1033802 RepID=F7Q4X2_9GAMM|nr:endo alpha-1,4 polygalactosaminidase [Salinisphaera shabanensis]ERJ18925.1 PelA protein [Salinisphaera shabanensis E1L3A]